MTEGTSSTPRRGVRLWVQLIIWVSLVGMLVIVAIELNRSQQGQVARGDRISNFTMPLFSGFELNGQNQFNLADYRGKVVMINFWASWCKPCEQEAADMEQAWQFYKDDGRVVFIGADYVDTEPEARAYLAKFSITYPNGPDLGTRVSQLFRIKGVPETYFIDPQGILQYAQIGPFSSVDEIKSIINPLLK
ncbi:MAG TPA: TlpA disulfide reductase family protein [Anaerolineales bacterium]|nr:TlpA disulfide reductase family protein [Anaerolineales bacterium]